MGLELSESLESEKRKQVCEGKEKRFFSFGSHPVSLSPSLLSSLLNSFCLLFCQRVCTC